MRGRTNTGKQSLRRAIFRLKRRSKTSFGQSTNRRDGLWMALCRTLQHWMMEMTMYLLPLSRRRQSWSGRLLSVCRRPLANRPRKDNPSLSTFSVTISFLLLHGLVRRILLRRVHHNKSPPSLRLNRRSPQIPCWGWISLAAVNPLEQAAVLQALHRHPEGLECPDPI